MEATLCSLRSDRWAKDGPRGLSWSHAERYFSEAAQLNPKDPLVTPIVARIDSLFAIDARRVAKR
jgi:hypothetical protein